MTKSNKKKRRKKVSEEPFREAFGRLGDLRAVLPGCPVVALSASLRITHRKLLQNVLHLSNAEVVNVSPNKENIRMLSVQVKHVEEALGQLDWLIKILKENGANSPKSIIFCNVMTDIAHVLSYMLLKLGEAAYLIKDNQKCWLIAIYHSKTWETSKEQIENQFSSEEGGLVRVVIATTALGMGVNYPDVKYIIHFLSPSRSLESHIQQLGRAGRNGELAHDITIYTLRALSQCEAEIKNIYKGDQCLRIGLFKHFDEAITSLSPKHLCCTVCAKSCNCEEQCQYIDPMHEISLPIDGEECRKSRTVTDEDKCEMKAALEDERDKITELEGGISLFGLQSLHGFSDSLISSVLDNLHLLFTCSDIVNLLPIFSLQHAHIILELVQEFFNDIDDFEDQIGVFEEAKKEMENEMELHSILNLFCDFDMNDKDSEDKLSSDSGEEEEFDDLAFLAELGMNF